MFSFRPETKAMPANTRTTDSKKPSHEVKENNKRTFSDKLAIANLFVTVLLGLVVTVLLQFNNQKFETLKLKLENDLQFANITVSSDDKSFTYTNQGASTAKNLQIVFCFAHINDEWKDVVKDTRFFSVSAENSAMKFSEIDDEDRCNAGGDLPIGGKLVTIEALPAQQSVRLALIPKSKLTSIRKYQGTAYIQEKVEKEPGPLQFGAAAGFYSFLAHKFAIAQFRTDLSCDNCRHAFVAADATINAPPVPLVIYSDEGGLTIVDDSNNTSKTTIDFTVTYHSPDGLTESTSNHVLYLGITDTPPYLQEIAKKDFDSGLP
jgi:hypothetical protein